MNILLDTLRTRLSFRWLGHVLGLMAASLPLWNWLSNTAKDGPALGASATATLLVLGPMAAALALFELCLAALDFRARKLKALAPTVFPLKKMEPADRGFVQAALAQGPARAYGRAWAVWSLAAGTLLLLQMGPGLVLLCFSLGAPIAALTQGLGNAGMLKRVLPFYYFEDGYADSLRQWLPLLESRFKRALWGPLSLVLPAALAAHLLKVDLSLLSLLWMGLWAWASVAATAWVLQSLIAEPARHLGEALGRLHHGDLNALLDVTSGDELGATTEAFNKATRAVDRRLFLLEKFHHAVLPGRSEGVLSDLRLDGELRPVAVLSAQWLDADSSLRGQEPKDALAALSRFYEAVQEAVDRHQGCTFELADGKVLAVWGAPFGPEQAVQSALGAAWDLMALLPVIAQQQRSRGVAGMQWGLGVASGQASAGLAGPRGRERYQVIGGPVHEARTLGSRGDGAWLDERSAAAAQAPYAAAIGPQGPRLITGPVPEAPTAAALGFAPGERL